VASRSQLYGVSPVDPLSFVGALAVLAVVAAAASAVPAWRASHLNIARALRNQ
jgi:ABC-type lipoprotein release transport system permease subunit